MAGLARGGRRLGTVQDTSGTPPGPMAEASPDLPQQAAAPLGLRAVDSEARASVVQARPENPPKAPRQRQRDVAGDQVPVRPASSPATIRPRHNGVMALAFVMIVLPAITSAVYLWGFAVDQYVSTAGFAIRNQGAMANPLEFLGAFGGGSSSTAKDTDILHSFIGSQKLVEKLDEQVGIRRIFSKPEDDPLFAFDTSGTIEDLVSYWGRMVHVSYDNTTGLIQLSVYAFTPEDAQTVAKAVLEEGTLLVNRLAAVARDDTTTYAKQSLDEAEGRLKKARSALTEFRIKNNIVDPVMDLTAMSKVYGVLTEQLVEAQVQLQILQDASTASTNDPRVVALQQRIAALEARIAEEQEKISSPTGAAEKGYADIVAEFQGLSADLEFGEKAYLAALASYDAAVEDAQRKQVYLAVYEGPTLAQAAVAPRRWLILVTVMVIGFLSWSIVTLVYYALRDRR